MPEDISRTLPTHSHVQAVIGRMLGEYDRLKAFPVGKSVLGRDITALSIGNPAGSVLYVGAAHGLEWLTAPLLLRFFENLLAALKTGGKVSDIDVGKALQSRSLTLIPCLNPDGVEIALGGPPAAGDRQGLVERLCRDRDCREVWQANANGVDLGRNFDAGWQLPGQTEADSGASGPAPAGYGGPHPHSEPETLAAATFCMTYQPRSLYCLHTQGEEIAYHTGDNTPVRSRMIAQILASSSGYALARPGGLASHGGFRDWYVEKLGRPGFSIQVGKGRNPLAPDQLDRIYRRTEEMLMLAALL